MIGIYQCINKECRKTVFRRKKLKGWVCFPEQKVILCDECKSKYCEIDEEKKIAILKCEINPKD